MKGPGRVAGCIAPRRAQGEERMEGGVKALASVPTGKTTSLGSSMFQNSITEAVNKLLRSDSGDDSETR